MNERENFFTPPLSQRDFTKKFGDSDEKKLCWVIEFLVYFGIFPFNSDFFGVWSSLLWGGKNAYIRGKKKLISKKNRMKGGKEKKQKF